VNVIVSFQSTVTSTDEASTQHGRHNQQQQQQQRTGLLFHYLKAYCIKYREHIHQRTVLTLGNT